MGKWKEKFEPHNNMNNGHRDDVDDEVTTPLQPTVNGDVTIVAATNGRGRNGHTTTTPIVEETPVPVYGLTSESNGQTMMMTEDADVNGTVVVTNNNNGDTSNGGGGGGGVVSNGNLDDSEGEGDDVLCGLGSYTPDGLQPWATKRTFLAVFCLTSVLQGMYYTYIVSVLTTIEKLLQIQSKTTGFIMSATEMGQIGGALLLTYYGGQGHRPRWIACGMIIFAIASFVCSLPHFIFGAELTQGVHMSGSLNRSQINLLNLCDSKYYLSEYYSTDDDTWSALDDFAANMSTTATTISSSPFSPLPSSASDAASMYQNVSMGRTLLRDRQKRCREVDTQNLARITSMVLTIFFISLLFIGIGATAVYTLGIPYIDDNVANRDSPLYFAITIGVRILGPVFGFLLGSLCTSIYVDPLEDPIFNNKDPRWIGAWWLGLFIVAAALVFSSFFMFLFPKELPRRKKYGSDCPRLPPLPIRKKPRLKAPLPMDTRQQSVNGSDEVAQVVAHRFNGNNNFPKAMKRLLKNDILLCRTASSVLHILPISGLYTFLPKYFESQFRMTATEANMVAGIAGILVMGVGIFASGMFMRRYKPNARFVAAWIAFTALAYAIGMFILMFIGCPLDDFASQDNVMSGVGKQITCDYNCNCEKQIFAPVCSTEGITYFSACHAGCQGHVFNRTGSDPIESFVNCTCLNPGVTATPGYCPLKCNNFLFYICVFIVFVLIHSTSEVGSMLLTLRCVDPKDKAMALGLISFAIGLFGNVPCPIIYGAVVDSACLVWEEICGTRGACWLYDPTLFRSFFNGVTGAIMFVGFIVDVVVWYKAKDIKFSDDEGTTTIVPDEETVPMNSSSPSTQPETSSA